MVITCDDELHQEEMPTSRTLLPPRILNASRVILHPPTGTSNKGEVKIVHLKQLLQRLPILRAQVKAGKTVENFLNEIRQLSIHCIMQNNFRENIQQFTQISIKMSVIFASSDNSKTSETEMLRLNIEDKIDLPKGDKPDILF